MDIHQKDIKSLWNHLKGSAKKRGIVFTIKPSDLNNLTFPITCPIFSMPLVFNRHKPRDNSYSVDRIDSSLGYEPDNIVIVSYKANRIKSDATLNELKQLVEFYSVL